LYLNKLYQAYIYKQRLQLTRKDEQVVMFTQLSKQEHILLTGCEISTRVGFLQELWFTEKIHIQISQYLQNCRKRWHLL
jgi:translation elongation factor P/translation initiation factor 5A